MKKSVFIVLLIALVAIPSFAQWRLDIGVDIPRGVGAVVGSDVLGSDAASAALSSTFFPFPEASIYYTFGGESILQVGVGMRCFTFIIESIAWPNIFAEVNLGPVAIEAQVGGGAFVAFGLANSADFGQVFFPDLSAWFKLGKKQAFRLGVGAIGLFLPELTTEAIPFVFYLGGKVALGL